MKMERSLPRAMQLSAPLKEYEADRVLITAWGLIGATQVPISWVTRCCGENYVNGETVLLRVVDGAWEGWKWMALDEFLQRISMDSWDSRQALVGMVLPPARRGTH
jgi:hypothetical protein